MKEKNNDFSIALELNTNLLSLKTSHQEGTESKPDIRDCVEPVLEAAGASSAAMETISIDSKNNLVTVSYRVPDLLSRQDDILSALGVAPIDIGNAVKLAELFMTGGLPEKAFEKMMDAEARENTPNADVSEFLRIIKEGLSERREEADEVPNQEDE